MKGRENVIKLTPFCVFSDRFTICISGLFRRGACEKGEVHDGIERDVVQHVMRMEIPGCRKISREYSH